MKPRKFRPLSYSRATDMDQTVVLSHIWQLRLGRMVLNASFQTRASVEIDKRRDAYCALRKQAVAAWGDPMAVEWIMEDLWNSGGTHETAMALMRRIVGGGLKNPWAD